MMDRLWMFLRRIYPRFDYLKDEQVVIVHHFPVDDFAFEIGVALVARTYGAAVAVRLILLNLSTLRPE